MPRSRPRPIDPASRPPLRERVRAVRYVPPLLKMVWQTHRGFTVTMITLRIVRSFVPVATLWVGKLIIDTVLAVRDGTLDIERLWKLVALEIGIVIISDLLGRVSVLVESLLGDLFSNHTSVRLMEHAATLDLYHFEDPDFYDQLERARRQTVGRIGLLAQILGMVQDTLTLISLGGALLIYSPWLLLLLAVAVLPGFFGETHFASLEYSLLFQWTPQRRKLDYLRFIGASDQTAKEIQMFGLSGWIIERYRTLADKFYEENKRLSIRKGLISAVLGVFSTLGYYAAYAIILLQTVESVITIGTMTFLAGSFSRGRDLMQRILMSAGGVFEQSLYLKDMFDFFEMKPSITSATNAPHVPEPIQQGFVFENVGFKYPGSERWAIRNVNFRIGPGERIAFVGENGAGKTTLTKLLARLYDPSEGRILLDGRDLRDYDLASLRQTISVIFQDFVRFDLRFDENIGVGRIEDVSDYLNEIEQTESQKNAAEYQAEMPVAIENAAEKSLASSLLPRFGKGYRQMLGRRFEGGVNLSGGEWQKVALARAYMRDAQVLILDEPTAALDARAEYEVFLRFSELVAGRIAVIISHRFSTVRMADRIVVLQHGTVMEEGTHTELLELGGLYAELFMMQAEGYR